MPQSPEALHRVDELEGADPTMLGVLAGPLLAQGEPRAARKAMTPLLDSPISEAGHRSWKVYVLLLEAIAHKSLGDVDASVYALERALDVAEPDHVVLSLMPPSEPTARQSFRTAPAPPVSAVVDLIGRTAATRPTPQRRQRKPLRDALRDREMGVNNRKQAVEQARVLGLLVP
jgi:hypothetical protein